MKITEKAKEFAIIAHAGQIRKSEPDKPMIIHPIAVAEILSEYGYDDEVISAGYLHDVVEDTKYTIQEIESIFGKNIADLVETASEPDKSLSWEERKKHTINEIKTKPFRNKLVVAADKIHNAYSLIDVIKLNGMAAFNSFKRGYADQLWYLERVYESLIYNEDKNTPIFSRLRKTLDELKTEVDYQLNLENEIFADKQELYKKLRDLHKQKYELLKLKQSGKLKKPFVIEFSGTPRTGKTSIINNLKDFFNKAGFKVSIVQEFTTSEHYKKHIWPKFYEMTRPEYQEIIIKEITKQLVEAVSNQESDIIILDRSIFDRCIWSQRLFDSAVITESENEDFMKRNLKTTKDNIDLLVLTYADPDISEQRDFISSLALEKRGFISIKNVAEFNNAMKNCKKRFMEINDNIITVDTTNISVMDSTLKITEFILNNLNKQPIITTAEKAIV